MGTTNTPKTNGVAAAKPVLPRAFGDFYHLALVLDYIERAMPLLAELDRTEQRDTLTARGRKAAEAFLRQAGKSLTEPGDDDDTED